MGFRSTLARLVGGSALEATNSSLSSLVDEDRGWRSLISGGMRELTWAQIIENLNDATEAYRTNPIAQRIVELFTDFIVGDGMTLSSADPAIQAELDLWWHHPLNRMDSRQFQLSNALTIDGELFTTLHTNPFDQTTYVRLVPAALIDRIQTNPDDLEDELRYHQTAQPMTPDTLMRYPSALQAEGRWWDHGAMFHYAINRPPGVVRGQGDLMPLLPWLRRYKDWLTDRVRINKYKTAYLWHVKITGADRRTIAQRQAELAEPPNPGSVIVSNENETWDAIQPKIAADDVWRDGYAIRLIIAAGSGLPLMYFGEAEYTARGTAAEMSAPTIRHFRRRQLHFGALMVDLAVEALHRRGLTRVTADDIQATFPALETEDQQLSAQALTSITSSLQAAQQAGWVSHEDAARVFSHFLGEPIGLTDPLQGGSTRKTTHDRRRRSAPVLPPSDPRAQEPLPPEFTGGGIIAPEPIVNI